MIIAALLITGIYCLLISAFVFGFSQIESYQLSGIASRHKFSILISFRDEEVALPKLLNSLATIDYPQDHFEILFIDDESQDNSVQLIERFFANMQLDFKIISNKRKSNSPKKDAITTGVQHAKFDWIITTDADCTVPINWLRVFDDFITKHDPKFIVAPVAYEQQSTFSNRFQVLDFLSLQGATIGGFGIRIPFLCNGANLCYSKSVFNEVHGYSGNEHIASGDDIFLLEKVHHKFPNHLYYLKSRAAIVKTLPQPNFRALLQQRIRWAAKSTGYQKKFSKFVALSVFAMNALLILLCMLSIFTYFNWFNLLLLFLIKFFVDGILILMTARFFNQTKVLISYFLSSLFYPFFTMFVAVASLSTNYVWKGRSYKK